VEFSEAYGRVHSALYEAVLYERFPTEEDWDALNQEMFTYIDKCVAKVMTYSVVAQYTNEPL